MRRITHWIGGKPWTGTAERYGDVYDPATGQVSGRVDFASAEDVDGAVAAAREAFPAWRDASLTKRANVLFAFRELVARHRGDLAALITSEHGKVRADAARRQPGAGDGRGQQDLTPVRSAHASPNRRFRRLSTPSNVNERHARPCGRTKL